MDRAGRRANGVETLPRDLNEALQLMRARINWSWIR